MKNEKLAFLVEKAQTGNRNALNQLCHELQNLIQMTLSKMIKNPDTLRELSQETFCRLISSLGNLKEPVKIKPYVCRITLNVINDYFREKYKWREILVKDDVIREIQGIDFSQNTNEDFLLDKLTANSLMDTIPDELNRKIIQMKYHGNPIKKISNELSISEGAVKMRFKRTIEYLKTILLSIFCVTF